MTDRFYYSKQWRAMRERALLRDSYCCVVCGILVAGNNEARIDHIRPRKEYPELELDLSNLRTLCAYHDNQSHREKGRAPRKDSLHTAASARSMHWMAATRIERFVHKGCDAQGMPRDPNHPWNKQKATQ